MGGDTDIPLLSAGELTQMYRAGTLSPLDAAHAAFAQIEQANPKVNAIWALDKEGALEAARASQARWRKDAALGPLDGVPVTLKDHMPVKGMPAAFGVVGMVPDGPAPADGIPAGRLRAAGAVMIGKTTMPDIGLPPAGVSSRHGVTRNPWGFDRTTGGSSSGAAAALACGMGALALGSDTGGSVRLPAAYCGVVGLKPTQGLMPHDLPGSITAYGPMARTVGDAASMLAVLAGPDARDYTSVPAPDDVFVPPAPFQGGGTVGVMPALGPDIPVDAEAVGVVEEVARYLEALGLKIEEMPPPLEAARDMIWGCFNAIACPGLFLQSGMAAQQGFLEHLPKFFHDGFGYAKELERDAVYRGVVMVEQLRRTIAGFMARYDFILTPASGQPQWEADRYVPDDDFFKIVDVVSFLFPFNVSGNPGLTLNGGFSREALPIGVQFVGQRFGDARLLSLAQALEEQLPSFSWPDLIAAEQQ